MKVTVPMLKQAIEAEDDFGHEMRVRRVLLGIPGAKVDHGGSYTDPLEGKPRQFDLRFKYATSEAAPRRMYLAVECKNLSEDSPLVVSGTDRAETESFHFFVGSMAKADPPIQGMRMPTYYLAGEKNEFYKVGSFVGKSLLRLKPEAKKAPNALVRASGQDEIYGRWSQALASANDLCREAVWADQPGRLRTRTLILPMVIVPDNTLWTISYDWDAVNTRGPAPADEAQYFVNHKVDIVLGQGWRASIRLANVHFLTIRGLHAFLKSLAREAQWDEWMPANAKEREFSL